MLTYQHDETIAHGLDPRAKLALQFGFTATALAHTSPPALLVLTALTLLFLYAARVSLWRAIVAYRFPLFVVLLAPIAAALTLGPPWIDVEDGLTTGQASYRIFLVILVSAAYVRSTPVRDSRAAIQRTIPGKPGQILGIGVALVFRFLPVLQADLRTVRDAMAARLGSERSVVERITTMGILVIERAFDRADRLALALQARCFAWNPTLPALSFRRRDFVALAVAIGLVMSAFV